LWASTHYDTDDFQIEASLKEEGGYYKYSNITTPCFVNSIGEGIDADAVFFSSDHDNEEPLYICAVNDRVTVIGRYIDEEISNFRDQVFFTSHRDEVPEWLDAHPVQRLLQLTSDLDEASAFALSPRIFTKESAFSRRSWGWAACLRHVCVTSASRLLHPNDRTLMVGSCGSASGRYCCKKIFGPGTRNNLSRTSPNGEY